MAHGTPASAEGIEPFYTKIRRGRPPSPEQLAELVSRYQAIGGTSPLAARTRRQVEALAAHLESREPGRYLVRYGAKHTDPSIELAAADLGRAGVDQVVGIVLAPHESSLGSGEYLARAAAQLEAVPGGPALVPVPKWYDVPGFAELVARRVRAALAGLRARVSGRIPVVFSAHSLPVRTQEQGDPYSSQVHQSAALVAAAAGLEDWQVAWQSAGRTPEPWIGPDILEVIRELAAQGAAGVVSCPVGFVADHLEVLYDLDVEARGVAEGVGLGFARTASLNDDPDLVAVLAGAVRAAAGAPRP